MSLKLFLLLATITVALLAADNLESARMPSNPSLNTLEREMLDVKLSNERRQSQFLLANVTAKRASPSVYETFPRSAGQGTIYVAHDSLANYDACGQNRVIMGIGGTQDAGRQMAYSNSLGKLYYLTASYVRRINLDGTGDEVAFSSSLNGGIVIDNVNNIIYLSSWSSGRIQKVQLDGTVINSNLVPTSKEPEQMALSGNTLYWPDEYFQSVEKVQTDGTNRVVLKSGSPLKKPQAVQVYNNIVYVSDYLADAIYTMKTDGTNFKPLVFVKSSAIAGMAIDSRNNLLYFADWGNDAVGAVNLLTAKCYAQLVTGIAGLVTPDGLYINQNRPAADLSAGCNTCSGQAVAKFFVIPESCDQITSSLDCGFYSDDWGLDCTYCYGAAKCIVSTETCPVSSSDTSSSS